MDQQQYEASIDTKEHQAWRDTHHTFAHLTKPEHDMPNVNEMIQSKYLKKEDIDDEMLVTIQSVDRTNIAKENEKPQWKFAMMFDELAKPLLLNSTNIKRTAKACDSDQSEEWIGKKVILFVDEEVTFGNDIVGGLRIRGVKRTKATLAQQQADAPKSKPSTSIQDMEDDIPF